VTLLTEPDAFYLDHRRCGELDGAGATPWPAEPSVSRVWYASDMPVSYRIDLRVGVVFESLSELGCKARKDYGRATLIERIGSLKSGPARI
jgi:hypothetical protein